MKNKYQEALDSLNPNKIKQKYTWRKSVELLQELIDKELNKMNNNIKIIKERKELKKLITNINNTITSIIMTKLMTEDKELKVILERLKKYLNKYNDITQFYYNELAEKININDIEIKDINDLIRYGII